MTIARPIDSALRDQNLLGAALGDASSWSTWLVALRAAAGLPLNEQQQQTFAAVAGNRAPPSHRVREFWCVVGRGGGKSRIGCGLRRPHCSAAAASVGGGRDWLCIGAEPDDIAGQDRVRLLPGLHRAEPSAQPGGRQHDPE